MRTGTRSTEIGLTEGRTAVRDDGAVTAPVSVAAGADGCGAGVPLSAAGRGWARGWGRGACFGASCDGMAARLRREMTKAAAAAASTMPIPNSHAQNGMLGSSCAGPFPASAFPSATVGVVICLSVVTPDCAEGSAGRCGSGVCEPVCRSSTCGWLAGRGSGRELAAGVAGGRSAAVDERLRAGAGATLRAGSGVVVGWVTGLEVVVGVDAGAGDRAGAGTVVGAVVGATGRVLTGSSGLTGPCTGGAWLGVGAGLGGRSKTGGCC